jgi:chlorobactene glucosyltransferase
MAGALTSHQTGLIFFLAALLAIAASNLLFLKRLGQSDAAPPVHLPKVSILVPARDEEANITACIASLLAQDYPDFEVLALDDRSADRTGDLLAELAGKNCRLQALSGRRLPAGWTGKSWACHQLAQAAGGEVLLFTDADTRHGPQALRQAVLSLTGNRCDLLSALPRQEVRTPGERLLVPVLYWSLLAFFPLGLAYWLPLPFLAVAVGQFMLIRRSAYERLGGYAAIRDQVADDLALARRAKAQRLHWRLLDGGGQVRCRMYHSFPEAWSGFRKNFFAAFGYRIMPFTLIWLWLGIVFLEPPLLLALGSLTGRFSGDSLRLAAMAAGEAALLWGLVLWRFRFPFFPAIIYPASVAVAVAIAGHSLLLSLKGQATWKGRSLPGPKARWW